MERNFSPDLVTIHHPRSPIAEAYRILRTNLEFSGLDRPLRILLVTSPGAEEGKSTVLANLGVVIAQAGKKVILADCDLRRPSLHELFGLPGNIGLTNMVVDEEAMKNPPLLETGIENLFLLPSGPLPPNPAEVLASRKMEEILKRLTSEADMVLLDAPPVISVTDALILASRSDGVILVVRAGHTRREIARKAKELLEKVNARILGSVLTDAPLDMRLQRYYGSWG